MPSLLSSSRTLAVLPLLAVALAAPPAQAAKISTVPCVGYVSGQRTMPLLGAGFTPNRTISILTSSGRKGAKRTPLLSTQTNALGALQTTVFPPAFATARRNLQTFELIGSDLSDPRKPIIARSTFQVVRFGLTRSPAPTRPVQKVTYTARGYKPGQPVYAHFRFAGVTRRTVNLGVAKAPCGIVSKRMRALPTTVFYGSWKVYIDQTKRFSANTRPQWIDPFEITKPVSSKKK